MKDETQEMTTIRPDLREGQWTCDDRIGHLNDGSVFLTPQRIYDRGNGDRSLAGVVTKFWTKNGAATIFPDGSEKKKEEEEHLYEEVPEGALCVGLRGKPIGPYGTVYEVVYSELLDKSEEQQIGNWTDGSYQKREQELREYNEKLEREFVEAKAKEKAGVEA